MAARMSEADVGILEFVSQMPGFSGIVKHRFRDFQVNEVDLQGTVAVLTHSQPAAEVHAEPLPLDRVAEAIPAAVAAFTDVAGAQAAQLLEALLTHIVKTTTEGSDAGAAGSDAGTASSPVQQGKDGMLSVTLGPSSDKEHRKAVHGFFKTNPHLPALTTTTVDVPVTAEPADSKSEEPAASAGATAAAAKTTTPCVQIQWRPSGGSRGGGGGGGKGGGGRGGGQGGRGGRGGGQNQRDVSWGGGVGEKYVKFVLYKENMDTQVALTSLVKALKLNPKAAPWGFAGTKDKRGVTAQFVTGFKIHPSKLLEVNFTHWLRGVKVGTISYCKEPLKLGQLLGNRFQILMRDLCPLEASELTEQEFEGQVSASCEALANKGFINYYGLQRFGTAGTPTHKVGEALLRGQFRQAVDLIMAAQETVSAQQQDPAQALFGAQQKPEVEAARRAWATERDARAAGRHLPPWMVAEKAIMNALASSQPRTPGAPRQHPGKRGPPSAAGPPAAKSPANGTAEGTPTVSDGTAQDSPAGKKQRLDEAGTSNDTAVAATAAVSATEATLTVSETAPQSAATAATTSATATEAVGPQPSSTEPAPWPTWLTERVAAEAIARVPRTLRLMYLHAWQSRLWNTAASHRVKTCGADRVVAGDLVLPRTKQASAAPSPDRPGAVLLELAGGGEEEGQVDGVGAADEAGAAGRGQDAAPETQGPAAASSGRVTRLDQVHVVTAEEAEAGTYSIEDVVLPLPGTRVQYPAHETGSLYQQLCQEDGVTIGQDGQGAEREKKLPGWAAPFSFSSLSGDYRRVVLRPRSFTYRLLRCSNINDDSLVQTGLDLLNQTSAAPPPAPDGPPLPPPPPLPAGHVGGPGGPILCVLLDFLLPSSAYATMLIREVTRQGTSRAFQAGLTQAAQAQAASGQGTDKDENAMLEA